MTEGNVSSLMEICLKSSLEYLETAKLSRNKNIFLPEDICEALICKKLKTGSCDDGFIATFFSDVHTCRMTKAHLSNSTITDTGLEMICCHPLREVDVSKCSELSAKSVKSLIKCKNTLISLNIAHCREMNSYRDLQHLTKLKNLDVSRTFIDQLEFQCLSALVELRRLVLSGTDIKSLEPIRSMPLLTTLDLSNCQSVESIVALEALKGYMI